MYIQKRDNFIISGRSLRDEYIFKMIGHESDVVFIQLYFSIG